MKSDVPHSTSANTRLFLTLIAATSFALVVLLVLLWAVPVIGLSNMPQAITWLNAVFFFSLICAILWLAMSLILAVVLKKPVLFSNRIRGISIKLFLPLMIFSGRFAGFSKEKVRSSFIRVNNELTLNENRRHPPEKILMLMPHCLQNSRCNYRLTYDINNCKRCGKCSIAGLLDLCDKYQVRLVIATGGTIARKIIKEIRPKMIIAVACERDLASGIQDAYPVPVFGILNQRPFGPCIDTTLSLPQVQWALRRFLQPDCNDEEKTARS